MYSNKRMMKVLSLILIFILLSLAGMVYAEPTKGPNIDKQFTNFLAIGDSISVGLSAEDGEGYADLFFRYLEEGEEYRKLKFRNRGIIGDTSTDLLEAIRHDERIGTKIKKAKVITISIGGNDLLGPIVETLGGVTPEELNAILLTGELPFELLVELNENLLNFIENWTLLLEEIATGAPEDADIYIMTVYNPLPKPTVYYPVGYVDIYNAVDFMIGQMNDAIDSSPSEFKVVEVYNLFDIHPRNPITGESDLTDFSLMSMNFDPHPNKLGHEEIAELLSSMH